MSLRAKLSSAESYCSEAEQGKSSDRRLGQGLRYLSLQHRASQGRYPLLLVFHTTSSLQKAQGLKLPSLCLLPAPLGIYFTSSEAEGTDVYSIATTAVSLWKRCQAKCIQAAGVLQTGPLFLVGTKSHQHQVSSPWSHKESCRKEAAAEEWVDASPSAKEGYLSIFVSRGNVSLQHYFNLQRMRKACSVVAEIDRAVRCPSLRERDHMCFARGVCFAS